MTKLLFIAVEFAPVNTTGNYRSLKFVKYLSSFGVQPIVVTLPVEDAVKIFGNRIDENLLKEIPEGTPIHRVPTKVVSKFILNNKILNFIRIYFNTDDKIVHKWKKTLSIELDKICKEHRPDAVYVTLPPFSSYRIGDIVEKYNIPLIVDMRDAWSNWCVSPWQSKLHYWSILAKERRILGKATKIVTTTTQISNQFQATHPGIKKEKYNIITNGYDWEETFRDEIVIPKMDDKDKIVIGYIGSFYYNPKVHKEKKKWWQKSFRQMLQYSPVNEDWSYRSPLYFMKTLKTLFEQEPDLKKKIIFEHVGRVPAWLLDMLKEYGLEDNFKSHGFVPYQKVLEIQKNFDFFLATAEKLVGGEQIFLPSKLFDYIKEQKPILGFVTEGVQKEFLTNSGLGIICNPDDVEKSATLLKNKLKGNFIVRPNKEFLKKYQRKEGAKKLAEIVKEIAK